MDEYQGQGGYNWAMKLSVIIPTYNRAHVLPRAVNSVLGQEFSDSMELIIVDDGSDDETAQLIAERYPDIRYVYQENNGVSAARNHGIKLAQGEWIALLDSDDEWLPNKLNQQFTECEKTALKVCHTEEIWIRNGVRVNQMNKHQKRGGWIYPHCLPLCAMSPSSIIIHNSVFDEVGVFDERLPACEDYDLWLRISSQYEVAYVEQACIKKFGGHEDQLSRLHWGMDRFRVIALQKMMDMFLRNSESASVISSGSNTSLNAQNSELTLNVLLKKLRILHKGAIKHGNEALSDECQRSLAKYGLIQP